jgi:hypothetical protein
VSDSPKRAELATTLDEKEAILINDASIKYADRLLEETGMAPTNSNLFSLIYVCTNLLLDRGVPPSLLNQLVDEAFKNPRKPRA